MSGIIAEKALESCGINTNRNVLPYDKKPPTVTSGLRIGLNTVTKLGMSKNEITEITEHIDDNLSNVVVKDDLSYDLNKTF